MNNKKINVDKTAQVVPDTDDLVQGICEDLMNVDSFLYASNKTVACYVTPRELNMLLCSLYDDCCNKAGYVSIDAFICYVQSRKESQK